MLANAGGPIAAFADAPAHSAFLNNEDDSLNGTSGILTPLLKLGSAEMRPVSKGNVAYIQRMKGGLGQ